MSSVRRYYSVESDPLCYVNLTEGDNSVYWWDFIEVACSVNFSGTWKPLFSCMLEGNSASPIQSVFDHVVQVQQWICCVCVCLCVRTFELNYL